MFLSLSLCPHQTVDMMSSCVLSSRALQLRPHWCKTAGPNPSKHFVGCNPLCAALWDACLSAPLFFLQKCYQASCFLPCICALDYSQLSMMLHTWPSWTCFCRSHLHAGYIQILTSSALAELPTTMSFTDCTSITARTVKNTKLAM